MTRITSYPSLLTLSLLLLAACDSSSGDVDSGPPGEDAGTTDALLEACFDACDLEDAAGCGLGCGSSCATEVERARASGCEAAGQAFFDCVQAADDVCAAFMGTAGPCGAEFTELRRCPLVERCTEACDAAAAECGGDSCASGCAGEVQAILDEGCDMEGQAFFDCVGGAADLCTAFMGTAGECGSQYTALQDCAGATLLAACQSACAAEEAAGCGVGCSAGCMDEVRAARAAGCGTEQQAFFDCVNAAANVCDAFMGTSGACAADYTALQDCLP